MRLLLTLAIFISGCTALTGTKDVKFSDLEGEWLQIRHPEQITFLEIHRFYFKNDSFKVQIERGSDIPDGPCGVHSWFEYAKGTYTLTKNSLILKGRYTNPDYDTTRTDCFSNESFITAYTYNYFPDDYLDLNVPSGWSINLKKVEK